MMIRIALPAILLLALPATAASDSAPTALLVNRLTWGQTANGDAMDGMRPGAWLEQQLHPSSDDGLPRQVAAQIAALEISNRPLTDIAAEVRGMQMELRQARKAGKQAVADQPMTMTKDTTVADAKSGEDIKAMRKPYRERLVSLALQASTRSLLRDLYSKNQLKEQLDWFWLNHFNVYARKGEIAALVGDYEETAIRPHVLGKFRDLLSATLHHPAMIQYLDNQQNAADKINENYAREIMELHTVGVGSGYTQKDVQELARILTGVGVNLSGRPRAAARFAREGYTAEGLFEFVPRRHDYGDKIFLGQIIKGSGLAEVDQAIDILARRPETAKHLSLQLAQYFCCDAPSPALVDAMAATYMKTDGEIADVLRTLFASMEFKASLGHQFKDPMHWTIAALRASTDGKTVTNVTPMVRWLIQMGEPLYGHETPDGYPMTSAAWSGPGQMSTRFDIARQIGAGAPQLFRGGDMMDAPGREPPPVLEQTAYYQSMQLPATTREAVAKGETQADRNMLFLSSPDFMRR